MRYSVIGVTKEQVEQTGGQDIKEAAGTGIIYADFDESGVTRLEALGARLKTVSDVIPDDISPPVAVPVEDGFTPMDLMAGIGFTDEFRYIIEPPLFGEGIAVAVIDSGIRNTHELINGSVVYAKNFTSSPDGDRYNHGTGVASVIKALAPACDLIDIKAIGDNGYGTDEAVVLGISEVITLKETREDLNIYCINLSLGKEDDGDPFDPLRVACRIAIQKGIWVAAAAGNMGPYSGTIMSPGSERYVISVGSINYDPVAPENSFQVSHFSSRGPTKEGLIKPDIMLLGEKVIVADSRSDTATTVKSGTSFATPMACGIGAIHYEGALKHARRLNEYQLPDVPADFVYTTPMEFLDFWAPRLTVKPLGSPHWKDTDYGYGILFGELAGLLLSGNVPSAISGDFLNSIVPLVGLAIVGMMIKPLAGALR